MMWLLAQYPPSKPAAFFTPSPAGFLAPTGMNLMLPLAVVCLLVAVGIALWIGTRHWRAWR